ncbi:hypothetical protein ADK55_29090 [Streptomyces sp. WM4235]|uniref:hypothetical protein n=1 Tax=Streptomyces sp. WM4235 TaxID=1415551 RepID=UPI0006AF008C|nr:hypothetical protein [Streptomyces sp. WM4235]KOU41251.1 hypothetical protein ADK55_29090 [Streptomyces sp. WM4235]
MAIPGNLLSAVTESVDPNTSGWAAKLNCAISKGTGGRNGDGTLKLTSTASGEMQARTAASYGVIAGQEYQVSADASGATVAERIGIRWLTSGGSEVSVTWSLTTATASATWHRISVAGVAPATAAKCQVLVSATPAGGGVINHFENVYLGTPMRTTGNLLSADAETIENATLKWVAETNCSIARQAPMVSWPVDNYLVGGQTLAITVTANGNAAAKVSETPSATAGTEYIGYCYLNPPTSGSTVWVELRFYTAANSLLSATRSNLAAPGAGFYQQRVSAVAPATTAYATLAAGITSGTAAQVMRVDGAVIATAPVIRVGSVLPYADASFEKDAGSWTVVSGVATLARSTPWGTYAVDGSYALTVSSATATTSVIRSAKYAVGAAAGLSFRLQLAENVSAGGWTINRSVRWYDAANVDLGLTSSGSATAPVPDWWSLTNSVTAPAGATQAAVELSLTATATTSVLRLDQVALWQAQSLIDAVVVDSSASVTVTLRELTVGYTLTVWRVLTGGARTLVRGSTGLIDGDVIAADQLVIEDAEAPLGVPVYYYVEILPPGGTTPESRTSATVTITAGDPNYAWLKDPGRPQRNMLLMVARAPVWQRPVPQAEYKVRGRRNSVVLSDVRGGLEGDLTIFTQTDEERESLHRLLDSGSVLLWQANPGLGVDDMYVNVGAVSEDRGEAIASDPWRTWSLPMKQADMPTSVGVAGSAGRTWQDILTENATWADVLAKYATWEDVRLNRPIGG